VRSYCSGGLDSAFKNVIAADGAMSTDVIHLGDISLNDDSA
jgi:hypothetical protein